MQERAMTVTMQQNTEEKAEENERKVKREACTGMSTDSKILRLTKEQSDDTSCVHNASIDVDNNGGGGSACRRQ